MGDRRSRERETLRYREGGEEQRVSSVGVALGVRSADTKY